MAQAQAAFSRGGDSAQAADEAARAASGGSFRKTHYLPKIGPGKQIVLRYITDSPDWFYAKAHPSAPTKNAPAWWPKERKWPESMPAVCRYDDAFQLQADHKTPLAEPIYPDCYICDAKLTNNWGRQCNPVVRVWALAVLREEVIGTQAHVDAGTITADKLGKRVGFRDAYREIEVVGPDGKATGAKESELAIIVVNQAVGNYFAGLQSAYDAYGTICDRDYFVKQNNEGKDVDYVHMPLNPTPALAPGTEKWKKYEEAVVAQGAALDIQAMLMDRSGDEFFALFFDPNKVAVERKKESKDGETQQGGQTSAGGAPDAQQQAAPSGDADPDKLAAMRERLRSGAGAAAPAETVQEPAAAPPAAQETAAAPATAQEPVGAAVGADADFD